MIGREKTTCVDIIKMNLKYGRRVVTTRIRQKSVPRRALNNEIIKNVNIFDELGNYKLLKTTHSFEVN